MRFKIAVPAMLAVAALALTGCVDNSGGAEPVPSSSTNVTVDQAARDLLPAGVIETGKLIVGMDATYPPNEYKDAEGKAIGWEVELMDAIAAKLGLTTDYQLAKFDNIIPSITGGKYNVGMSSFFDNPERQLQVDLVDYFTAGIQWAQKAGEPAVDPDNACGLKIAVQNGTYQALDDVPARSDACVAAGKPAIEILGYDTQDDATAAVALGRAAAMTADSPVTLYAVSKSDGELVTAGDIYEVVFYGMPIDKASGLGEPLMMAVQALIDDGTYGEILAAWGVESGAITTAEINGAK
jgi:polar amino acid transport system substrate-binding protein